MTSHANFASLLPPPPYSFGLQFGVLIVLGKYTVYKYTSDFFASLVDQTSLCVTVCVPSNDIQYYSRPFQTNYWGGEFANTGACCGNSTKVNV